MDYVVGLGLLCFGIYCLMSSDQFFNADWTPKRATCTCHAAGTKTKEMRLVKSLRRPEKLRIAFGPEPAGEGTWLREHGAAIVGFVQGLACPGLLLGISFLKA